METGVIRLELDQMLDRKDLEQKVILSRKVRHVTSAMKSAITGRIVRWRKKGRSLWRERANGSNWKTWVRQFITYARKIR